MTEVLWEHDDGSLITEDDVDLAIIVALWEINRDEEPIQHEWVSHPCFKECVIEEGKFNNVHPSTIIEDNRRFCDEEDMKSDLEQWKKEEK